MLDSQQIQTIRATIHSIHEQCNVSYKVTPYNYDLHRECVDEAVRRGYPVQGDHSVCRFLGIWTALYTACLVYVDEIPVRFPSEIPHIYMFTDRFFAMQRQGSAILDALADTIRRAPDLFQPIAAKLIITSSLNFFTANLLEYESESMRISSVAHQYPIYQRRMTGIAEGYAYMAFPPEIPLADYVQAIPELMLFITDMNDVLSFYKEELAGENANQISILAACRRESHLKAFQSLSDITVGHYKTIMKILEGYPEACEAFRHFCAGYIDFHTASERYKLAELNL